MITTTGLLEDDRKIRVGSGNVDDLTDALDGTRLEGYVPDAGSLQCSNDLRGLLGGRDTNCNTETFHRGTLAAYLLS
jgi:hypothetical protein